jgi:hypothetical protein
MMKLILALLSIMVLVAPVPALAGGNGAEVGHYSYDEFYWDQTYMGWGPACYYEQYVRVIYRATNTWTYVLKKEDVRETLVQNGSASIYDLDGNLLDERGFHVTERFFDEGTDVAIRHDYGSSVWYQASHAWWNSKLEDYQYIWKIPGVYDFRAWNRSGDWSYGWTSGDCEGGDPDGWPPKPPHPFNGD